MNPYRLGYFSTTFVVARPIKQSASGHFQRPLALRPPGLVFHEFNLANQPGCCSEDWYSKAILPGISSSTSVPAPARLRTLRLAPISSLRSRIPDRPKCPSRPDRSIGGSIPQPLSRTRIRNCLEPYSNITWILLAREWRKALTNASRPIR